jgi:segregation and condensation protein A
VSDVDDKGAWSDGELDLPDSSFVIDIEGFEGPIDALLTLARDQKVDLIHISVLQLADQYLAFVTSARRKSLELAADYLVMAAWLAYLKSRLLLPDLGSEDEPSGEEMAAALAFQMQRLEAMQNVGARLMARPHLGEDFFSRGAPELPASEEKTVFEVTLFDLLSAYGDHKRRAERGEALHIERWELYTVEDAISRLKRLLGNMPEWTELWQFLPDEIRAGQPGVKGGLSTRSALASTLAAGLELAREGKLKMRQSEIFGPIYLQAARPHLTQKGPAKE